MGGGDDPKMRITQYYASIHYGICHGAVDRLLSIIVNEKELVRCGGERTGPFRIDAMTLFGGRKKEGGLYGRVAFQRGNYSQELDSYCAKKLGGTPSTVPGYRGIATAFFTEREGDAKGFYWSANQPFVPPVHFRVTRINRAWRSDIAAIPGPIDSKNNAICFAIDTSGSMAGERLDAAKAAVVDILQRLKNSQYPKSFDIRVVSWSASTSAKQFRNCSQNEYDELIDFVEGFTAEGDTVFTTAVAGLADFYNGADDDKCRYFVFLTDGLPSSSADATTAGQVVEATGATAFAFNLLLTDTTQTEKMDNTPEDGVPVITSITDDTLRNSLLTAVTRQLDMNPAHIMRECMVNQVWGLGLPETMLDNDAFEAVAETLYQAEFGLSMMWVAQTSVEEFLGEVLDHINGVLYVDPKTGKFVPKLIRNDYDLSTALALDPSNCKVKTFKRRTPAETVGEIIVTWTNPKNENEETVVAQSLGTIVANGGEIISDNRNYYGVRRRKLAARLARRDLSAATAPLAMAEVTVNRIGWALTPGQVVKFTSPEHGAFELAMRVNTVNYGSVGNSEIEVTLTEDVFSYLTPDDEDPQEPESEDTADTAQPPSVIEFMTPNFYVASQAGYGFTDPDARAAFIVSSDQEDAVAMEVLVERLNTIGNLEFTSIGTYQIVGRSTLVATLASEATTTGVELTSVVGTFPEVGGFAIIGADGLAEDAHEIALITAVDEETGLFTLRRGVLDTVPRDWDVGTPVRYLVGGEKIVESELSTIGVAKDYKFQTHTSLGELAVEDSPVAAYTPTDRYFSPTRPANVVVQGSAFNPVDMRGYSGDITVTWANRNRLNEITSVLAWTDPNATPEAGQTTTIRLIDDITGVTITQFTGLTGTSYTFPSTARGSSDWVRVVVVSVRDGIESIQGHEVLLFWALLDPESLTGSAWLDVNDLGSVWQDVDGTVPVAADGDPVALIENQRSNIL